MTPLLTTAKGLVDAAMTAANPQITAAQTQLSTAQGLAFSKIVSVDSTGLITYLGQDGVTTNYYNGSGQPGVAATAANAATAQRVAVVNVTNPNGLEKAGGTLYSSTASTVDMSTEFVNLLTTQRAYSANSKTITTADEMTQDVLGLIR